MPVGGIDTKIFSAVQDNTKIDLPIAPVEVGKPATKTEINFKDLSANTPDVSSKDDVCRVTGYSKNFIDSVIRYEGCKLDMYKDACGKKTIGVGHNISADSTYHYGRHISNEECYKLLAKDLLKAKKALRECVGDVNLKKGQEEALVDIIFNVGVDKFKSTKLANYVKNGQFDKAILEFNFISINGRANPHLVRRRVDNIKRFSDGKYSAQTQNVINTLIDKGLDSYNRKIRKSGFLKAFYYSILKNIYEYQVKNLGS